MDNYSLADLHRDLAANHATGLPSVQEIARRYGKSPSAIRSIRHRLHGTIPAGVRETRCHRLGAKQPIPNSEIAERIAAARLAKHVAVAVNPQWDVPLVRRCRHVSAIRGSTAY